jgi:hypothetical protein
LELAKKVVEQEKIIGPAPDAGRQQFTEKQSERVVISDQGKVDALRHVTKPPTLEAQIELSDWNEIEVELYTFALVQSEYQKNPEIDCVARHMYWKSVLRRGVGSQLTEQIILLNRSNYDPSKGLGGMGGGGISPEGMDL